MMRPAGLHEAFPTIPDPRRLRPHPAAAAVHDAVFPVQPAATGQGFRFDPAGELPQHHRRRTHDRGDREAGQRAPADPGGLPGGGAGAVHAESPRFHAVAGPGKGQYHHPGGSGAGPGDRSRLPELHRSEPAPAERGPSPAGTSRTLLPRIGAAAVPPGPTGLRGPAGAEPDHHVRLQRAGPPGGGEGHGEPAGHRHGGDPIGAFFQFLPFEPDRPAAGPRDRRNPRDRKGRFRGGDFNEFRGRAGPAGERLQQHGQAAAALP